MAFAMSSTFKVVVGTAVGLASLANCAPLPAMNQTAAAEQTITRTTTVRLTATSTKVHATTVTVTPSVNVTTAKVATETTKSFHLRTATDLSDLDPSEDDDTTEDNVNIDLITNAARLLGISTEQMSKFQLETTDPDLVEPTGDANPDLAKIQALSNGLDNGQSFPSTAAALAVAGGLKFDEQTKPHGVRVALINATPYQWELVSSDTKHIGGSFKHPARVIEPGHPYKAFARTNGKRGHAEARYRLVGTQEDSWFTLKISEGKPHQVTVEYGGALRTVGNDNGAAVVDLGVSAGVVCPTFVLAGAEGRFVGNDIPTGWMRAMMPEIGPRTLREIMLPRSHHTGMYRVQRRLGLGTKGNTITQDYDVYWQLAHGGVRVIDSRPVVDKHGAVYESHGTPLLGLYHGAFGATQAEMVRQINQFNDDHPGELIIIDVDWNEMRDEKRKFKHMRADTVTKVVEGWKALKHRAVLAPGVDLSKIPLNRLLADGKSAVIVRMEESTIRDVPNWPGPAGGFITSAELPLRKHFSDTGNGQRMLRDQIRALQHARQGGAAWPVYGSDFIITQMGASLFGGATVVNLNRPAWNMLVDDFWNAFRDELYPNWLTMDAVRGNALRSVAVAVNECFVAKRCGTLGGRVSDAAPLQIHESAEALAARGDESLYGAVSADSTTIGLDDEDKDNDNEETQDDMETTWW